MSGATIYCRFCGGSRPTDGGRCLGCGTKAERAKVAPPKPGTNRPKCPACRDAVGKSQEVEPGRFYCPNCRAFFEPDDVGYLDTRPDRNAEKRESFQRSRRRRRR